MAKKCKHDNGIPLKMENGIPLNMAKMMNQKWQTL
jgi:hypothetical protein